MKIHSDTLTEDDLFNSLFAANDRGRVADSVYFAKLDPASSRSRLHGFEIQLASSEKVSVDEWGWIIAELFKRDPTAIVGGYDGIKDFNRRSSYTFTERQG